MKTAIYVRSAKENELSMRDVERFIFAINDMEKKNHSEKCRQGWINRKRKKEGC